MVAAIHSLIEPPILPGGLLWTVDGAKSLDEFAVLPIEEKRRLAYEDDAVILAATMSQVTGIVSWPGSLRWKELAREGKKAPALAHNAHVVSLLFAADVLACPHNPFRRRGEQSIFGDAASEWVTGDISIPKGIYGQVVTVTNHHRLMAWSQIMDDIKRLSIKQSDLSTSKERLPFIGAEVLATAESSLATGGRELIESSVVRTKRFSKLVDKPALKWATGVSMAVYAGNADFLDHCGGLEPPQSVDSVCPTPEELCSRVEKNRRIALAGTLGGITAAAVVGIAYAFGARPGTARALGGIARAVVEAEKESKRSAVATRRGKNRFMPPVRPAPQQKGVEDGLQAWDASQK